MFNEQKPSIPFSMVGFGQAGSRIANEFAKFKYSDPSGAMMNCYKVFAFNSTSRDFAGLNEIPESNLIDLNLDGFGKAPSLAYDYLLANEGVYKQIEEMVDKAYQSSKELIVFSAGLGGGTGTASILIATKIFITKYVNEIVKNRAIKMVEQHGFTYEEFANDPELSKNLGQLHQQAYEHAEQLGELKKLGLIVTLPKRSDGPGVLREVNKFVNELWELTTVEQNRIAFILPVDNQKASDEWNKKKDSINFKTFRDYANDSVANLLHEINCATNMGGSDITFDAQDFRRCILENQGTLVIGKKAINKGDIVNSDSMFNALSDAWQDGHILHDKIEWEIILEEEDTIGYHEVYNVGLLTVMNPDVVGERKINTSYLDSTQDYLSANFSLVGECKIFSGQIETKAVTNNVYAYTFCKTSALPKRLSTGLVEEYHEYNERVKQETFVKSKIQRLDDSIETPSQGKTFTMNDNLLQKKNDGISNLFVKNGQASEVQDSVVDEAAEKEKKRQDFLKQLQNGGAKDPFGVIKN